MNFIRIILISIRSFVLHTQFNFSIFKFHFFSQVLCDELFLEFTFHYWVLKWPCEFYLCSVWVARRPPGYAFIDFDDRRDAQDAIRELDGTFE